MTDPEIYILAPGEPDPEPKPRKAKAPTAPPIPKINPLTEQRHRILAEIETLCQEAEQLECVLYCGLNPDSTFTPAQLRAAVSEGRFILSRNNWSLLSRERYADKLRRQIYALQSKLDEILK